MFNSNTINERMLREKAKRIPAPVRKKILKDKLIDKATPHYQLNSPMEFLFDVYVEFISKEHDDFSCPECRNHVYNEFIKMKPILEKL